MCLERGTWEGDFGLCPEGLETQISPAGPCLGNGLPLLCLTVPTFTLLKPKVSVSSLPTCYLPFPTGQSPQTRESSRWSTRSHRLGLGLMGLPAPHSSHKGKVRYDLYSRPTGCTLEFLEFLSLGLRICKEDSQTRGKNGVYWFHVKDTNKEPDEETEIWKGPES